MPSLGTKYVFNLVVIVPVICISQVAALAEDQVLSQGGAAMGDPIRKESESRDFSNSNKLEFLDNDRITFEDILDKKYIDSQKTCTFKDLTKNVNMLVPYNKRNFKHLVNSDGEHLKRVQNGYGDKEKEESVDQFIFPSFRKRNLEHLAKTSGGYLKRFESDKEREETVDKFIFPSFGKRNLEHLAKISGGYLKRDQNNNDDTDKEEAVGKFTFPSFHKRNLEYLAKTSGGYLKRDQNDNDDKDKEEAVDKFTFPLFRKRNLEYLAKSSGGYLRRIKYDNGGTDREQNVDKIVKAIHEIVGKHKRGVHVLAKNRDFPNKKPKQKMKQVSVTTYIYMKRRNPDYQTFQD